MAGASVTQGVWSIVWQLQVKRLQLQLNHCSQTRNCERLRRRLQPQENLAKICLWTRLAQIKQDGLAHFPHQWILMFPILLGARHDNKFSLPIQILKAQPTNLSTAEAVDSQQHDDGAVANVTWPLLANTCDQLLYLGP